MLLDLLNASNLKKIKVATAYHYRWFITTQLISSIQRILQDKHNMHTYLPALRSNSANSSLYTLQYHYFCLLLCIKLKQGSLFRWQFLLEL